MKNKSFAFVCLLAATLALTITAPPACAQGVQSSSTFERIRTNSATQVVLVIDNPRLARSQAASTVLESIN